MTAVASLNKAPQVAVEASPGSSYVDLIKKDRCAVKLVSDTVLHGVPEDVTHVNLPAVLILSPDRA
jgi:hypothetical protein